METYREMTKEKAVKYSVFATTLVLQFVFLYTLVATIATIPQKNDDFFKVEVLSDFIALYTDEKHLILLDREPNHGSLLFTPESVALVKNFTNSCILCSFGKCEHEDGAISVPLSVSYAARLTIHNFEICKIPSQSRCFMYNREFNCIDLIKLTKLTE